MNDWPEGWGESQDGGDRGYGRGSASARPEGARAMPHVQRGQGGGSRRSAPPRPTVPAQPSYGEGHGDQYDSGYNTGQVYGGGGGRRGGGYVPNDNDPADGYAPRGRGRTGAGASSGPSSPSSSCSPA